MKAKNDLVISVILFAVSMTFFIMGFSIPSAEFSAGSIGPALFPQIWQVLLAILSIVLFFRALNEMKKQKKSEQKNQQKLFNKTTFWIIFVVISLSIYLILMPVIGYITATFIYCFICVFVYGYESYKLNIKRGLVISFITSLFIAGISFTLFSVILNVILPRGIFI